MRAISLALHLVVCSAVFGCSVASGPAPGETIAVFTKNQSNPLFQSIRLGAEQAAAQMSANVIHYIPTRPDSIPEQISQIEDALIRRPDGVVFIPVDYVAMTPGVNQLLQAGLPVVSILERVPNTEVTSFIGIVEEDLAVLTARYLFDAMEGTGRLVILEGVGGSGNNQMRLDGFRATLAEYPDITLVASQPANFQRLQALHVMENLMQSYPQIDGVLAANEAMALGAIEALEAANREALVVGFGGTLDAVHAVRDGTLLATGDNNGYLQGCLGTMAAIRHLRGLPVPAELHLPLRVIDRSNYHESEQPYEQRTCPEWTAFIQET